MPALKSTSAVAWQRALRCVWVAKADRVHSAPALKSTSAVVWQRSSRCVWATKADRVHIGACAEKHIGGRVAALIAVRLGGRDRLGPQRRLC